MAMVPRTAGVATPVLVGSLPKPIMSFIPLRNEGLAPKQIQVTSGDASPNPAGGTGQRGQQHPQRMEWNWWHQMFCLVSWTSSGHLQPHLGSTSHRTALGKQPGSFHLFSSPWRGTRVGHEEVMVTYPRPLPSSRLLRSHRGLFVL